MCKSAYYYTPISSPDGWCVPVVLKMILDASYSNSISLEELASCFTIVKPYSDEPRKWGASIKQDQINQIFSKYQIPLREDYLRITHIPDYHFLSVIKDAIKSQKHIAFGYSFGRLFKEYDKLAVGHLSLITEICGDNVTILNPGPKNAGYHTFSVDSIYQAVREQADGLWLISRRNIDGSIYGHI